MNFWKRNALFFKALCVGIEKKKFPLKIKDYPSNNKGKFAKQFFIEEYLRSYSKQKKANLLFFNENSVKIPEFKPVLKNYEKILIDTNSIILNLQIKNQYNFTGLYENIFEIMGFTKQYEELIENLYRHNNYGILKEIYNKNCLLKQILGKKHKTDKEIREKNEFDKNFYSLMLSCNFTNIAYFITELNKISDHEIEIYEILIKIFQSAYFRSQNLKLSENSLSILVSKFNKLNQINQENLNRISEIQQKLSQKYYSNNNKNKNLIGISFNGKLGRNLIIQKRKVNILCEISKDELNKLKNENYEKIKMSFYFEKDKITGEKAANFINEFKMIINEPELMLL